MIDRLCVLAILALCSGAANSQLQGNPAAPCYESLAEDARFSPIREKVALGGALDGMRRMTASGERAGAQDGPVLAAWRNARDACHRLEAEYFAKRDEGVATLAREHFSAVQALIAELQSGNLTYGEFSKRRLGLYEKTSSRIEEIRRSVLPPKTIPHTFGG